MTMSNSVTSALRIDTLAFAKQLKDAGADERLAEAIVEGLAVADISHLATKDDLKDEIAGVKAELKDEIAGVKDEIAGVKAELTRFATKDDIAVLSGKIDRLMYALVAFCVALVVALVGSSSF